MSALFPTSLPLAGSASSSDTLAAAGHTALHNNDRDEIRAVATKIGTGSSTPVSGRVLRGNGAGTSAWAQVDLSTDVTSTLPVANGGTGTTSTTGTGSVVFSNSPTIVTPTINTGGTWNGGPTIVQPTIADFTNAQHDHLDADDGGALSLPSEQLNATIASRAYRAAAFTVGAEADIVFDTENFDLGSDFSTATGQFTAPTTGYYHVDVNLGITNIGDAEQVLLRIYANGVAVALAAGVGSAAGSDPRINLSDIVFVNAGEIIKATSNASASVTGEVGPTSTYMSIYFIGV